MDTRRRVGGGHIWDMLDIGRAWVVRDGIGTTSS
jgi:hypothetical protein